MREIWNIIILAIKLKISSGLKMLSTYFSPNLNFSCELQCAKWEEITLITCAKYKRHGHILLPYLVNQSLGISINESALEIIFTISVIYCVTTS